LMLWFVDGFDAPRDLQHHMLRPLASGLIVRQPEPEAICSIHEGWVHGGEAAELRDGIEDAISDMDEGGDKERFQSLLDKVDARDSLAHDELANSQIGRQPEARWDTTTPNSRWIDIGSGNTLAAKSPGHAQSIVEAHNAALMANVYPHSRFLQVSSPSTPESNVNGDNDRQPVVFIHDDGCGAVLDSDGNCPVCDFHPDMQSRAIVKPNKGDE